MDRINPISEILHTPLIILLFSLELDLCIIPVYCSSYLVTSSCRSSRHPRNQLFLLVDTSTKTIIDNTYTVFAFCSFNLPVTEIYRMAQLNCLNLFNVQGRVAVVTGGSSGVGLMICKVNIILPIASDLKKLTPHSGTGVKWRQSLRCRFTK